jgi:hypothetical protein
LQKNESAASTKALNFASGNEANFRGERLRIARLGDNLQLFGRRAPNHHSPNRRRNLNFANANAAISSRFIVTPRVHHARSLQTFAAGQDVHVPPRRFDRREAPTGGAPKARADLSPLAERG